MLRAGIGAHGLVLSLQRTGNLSAGGPDPTLAEADIAFGQPDPQQVIELRKLRWIHLSSAGYTRYDRPDIRAALTAREAVMTNSSSVFDEPCAQHLLSFMLADARQLFAAARDQAGPRAWPATALRRRSRLLNGQIVLILGFGAIARRLVELLTPLKAKMIAVRQTPRGDEPIPVEPVKNIDQLLPTADHVVNILPANAGTERFIDADRFGRMKTGAVFYNIGRGTTINQAALVNSLKSGHLAAAYLDVTDPEPLPSNHELWAAPNCHITPHTAGGHIAEFEDMTQHFLVNFQHFKAGLPLKDRIL